MKRDRGTGPRCAARRGTGDLPSRRVLSWAHLLVLLGSLVACSPAIMPGDGSPALWIPAGDCTPVTDDPQRVACQRVTLKPGLLRGQAPRMTLHLPDPDSRPVVVEREPGPGDPAPDIAGWRGTIVGDPYSRVDFATAGEAVAGQVVTSDGRVYRLGASRGDGAIVERLDPAQLPAERLLDLPDAATIPGATEPAAAIGLPASALPPIGAPCGMPSEQVVCLLVVYTDRAAGGWVISEWWLRIAIGIAISHLDLSFRNSGVSRRIQVAPVQKVAFVEAGELKKDLPALWHDPQIQGLRKQEKADLVVLVTGHPSLGAAGAQFGPTHLGKLGFAPGSFAPGAYAIVPRQALLNGQYSFAHELGHLMGANHDAMSGYVGPGPYCYSHGHIDALPGKSPLPGIQCPAWTDLMSESFCEACTRQPYWSSGEPNFNFCGRPLGNPYTEDNARTLNETYDTVATFW